MVRGHSVESSDLITDSLLSQLIATGQADIVVGMVSFNNAESLKVQVKTILEAFSGPLLRERTVLAAIDLGSSDDSVLITRGNYSGFGSPHPLRTVHRIAESYNNLPNTGLAFKILLHIAELLQTQCLILVDPNDQGLTVTEIAELARLSLKRQVELIRPKFARQPSEGLLITQLIRPLVAAFWGVPIAEPLGLPAVLSGTLVNLLLKEISWTLAPNFYAANLEVTLMAAEKRQSLGELRLAPRQLFPAHQRELKEVFGEIVSHLLVQIKRLAGSHLLPPPWTSLGQEDSGEMILKEFPDSRIYLNQFLAAREALEPLWRQILAPETFNRLIPLFEAQRGIDEELWTDIVFDFVRAHQSGIMPIMQLVPILFRFYDGRVAGMIETYCKRTPDKAFDSNESLLRLFVNTRQHLSL